MDDRYQNQPWYIRLWRRRWYLMIPYWTLRMWGQKWSDGERTSLRLAYSIAIGTAQGEMKWWYTFDECKAKWGFGDEDSV